MSLFQTTEEITLVEVQRLEIHGSVYHQVTYRSASNGEVHTIRINPEAFYPDPKVGDRVSVNLLMGNIMGAVKLP